MGALVTYKMLFSSVIFVATIQICSALRAHHGAMDPRVLTWTTASEYCDRQAMHLCTHTEICANNNPPVIGVLTGDNWVPIGDQYNDWTQVGSERLCYKHIEHYGQPSWGLSGCDGSTCPHKKNILCCAGVELDGAYTTYDSARSYCLERGQDLCKFEEICPNNQLDPVNVISGDHWAPIRDVYNNWVEIGDDAGRTCYNHIARYGVPTWGTTIGDCSPWNTLEKPCPHKGNVICCPSSDPETVPGPYPYNIYHFMLNPTMTWDIARRFCKAQPGRDLCSSGQICPYGIPLLTGVVQGDNWAPIIDSNLQGIHDWVEIGNDENALRYARRVCYTHNEHYGDTLWGDNTTGCSRWSDSNGVCKIKRHVFCCSPKAQKICA